MKRVILGAHFDASDDHLTPIGPLAGVEIHAAVALRLDEKVCLWLSLLVDLLFGLAFGYGVHAVWTRYFNQLLGTAHLPPTVSAQALAYLWPSMLAVVWLVLAVIVLPLMSLFALLWMKAWINPVPMLVGMTVDAFMLGSVASAIHHAGHGVRPRPDPPRARWRRALLAVLAWLPTIAWWLVLALAAVKLVRSL